MDYQFWTSLVVTVGIGGYNAYLVRSQLAIMRQQVGEPRRRASYWLSYRSMVIMIVLVGASWLPYVLGLNAKVSTPFRFAQWLVPDGKACAVAIDASQFPSHRRDKYEIALVCGVANPTTDKVRDERITVSSLFTPQDVIQITAPFSSVMAEFLNHAHESALKQVNAPKGSQVTLVNTIWFKIILLPRGSDPTRVKQLSDVALQGGEITNAEVAVGIVRVVPMR